MQRPDALFAHGNGPARAAIIATRFLPGRPRVVTAEHNHYSSYAWRLRWIRHVLNRLLLPHADHVVGVAPEIVEDLEQQFPGVVGRTSFIPEPLTRWRRLEELAREPIDHPWFTGEGDDVVVSVANIHPRKDPLTLVRAMVLANRRSRTPIRLLVIGRVLDTELRAQLERAIADADMADRFAFLGFVPNPMPYIRRATVFALTSTNEGLPVALLEAMALGVPMVSTDAPSGPRFLLEGGRYGRLVPVGSHEAVADAILELVANAGERERLARLGRARADHFSPSRVADKYLAVGR